MKSPLITGATGKQGTGSDEIFEEIVGKLNFDSTGIEPYITTAILVCKIMSSD